MDINNIKNWINQQKTDIPQTSAIEIARTQGFFQGALKTIQTLENYINEVEQTEHKEVQSNRSKKVDKD